MLLDMAISSHQPTEEREVIVSITVWVGPEKAIDQQGVKEGAEDLQHSTARNEEGAQREPHVAKYKRDRDDDFSEVLRDELLHGIVLDVVVRDARRIPVVEEILKRR